MEYQVNWLSEETAMEQLNRKKLVIQKLKEKGCRITRQRELILDVILSGNYSCCKEICYQVEKLDSGIGSATVYRMIQTLEEIGAINRENMYRIHHQVPSTGSCCCEIRTDKGRICQLSEREWKEVIHAGLMAHGYIES